MAQNTLESIPTILDQSIHPQFAKQAEAQLKSLEPNQGFSVNLLHIVALTNLSIQTRLAGALFFKNLIKRKWINEDGEYLLPLDDINQIKTQILDVMINLPNNLQIQIGESISIIAESDFPHNWQNLIDELVSKLSTTDFVLNKGILLVAHSIFKKWRPLFRSDELFLEIKMVLDKFAQPFLSLLIKVDELIQQSLSNDKASLEIYFENLLLLTQIYYDLNCQDIPEFFEDNLSIGMNIMHKYLQLSTPLLTDADDDENIDIAIKVKTSIVELILLYISRYAEEFDPLIEQFITTVWNLINQYVTKQQKYDLLVVKSLTFLTSISKISKYQYYFNNESSLKEIIEKIILPNIYFREVDEELFEDEPINYVRSDLEGSDFDTRRKSATDFLRELKEVNTELLTSTVMTYVNQFLNLGDDWKNKDVAIYLFSSLAAKGSVTNIGVTSTNVLIDVVEFFSNNIANDLVSDQAHLNLKTDAIKYIFTFRNQLTKDQLLTTIPLLINHLNNPNPVVYTYSAITIEKLLSMTNFTDHSPVFTKSDIQPFVNDLLTNLFRLVLSNNSSPEKLAENEFLIKSIMRVLNTAEDIIDPQFKITIINQMLQILQLISKNPSNPKFTHYIFESLGLLIKFSDSSNISDDQRIPQYIQLILPSLLSILGDDVQEFVPYVFQILAFLLELLPSSSPLPDDYKNLIKPLLSPIVWEFRGNIPGIFRLLIAILEQEPQVFASSEADLTPLLGVFQKLIASKANDQYGFDLLQVILLKIPLNILSNYLNQIGILLLTRLKNSRTDKFIKKFVVFLTSLCCIPLNPVYEEIGKSINADFIVQFIDSVQPGVFQLIYNNFILPTTGTLVNSQDKKVATLGLSELINSKSLKENYTSLVIPTIEALCKNLNSLSGIQKSTNNAVLGNTLSSETASIAINELDLESFSFGSQFSKIVSIQKKPFDPLPSVKSNDQQSIRFGAISNIKKLGDTGVLNQLSDEAKSVLNSM